jgi:hypothetical protein
MIKSLIMKSKSLFGLNADDKKVRDPQPRNLSGYSDDQIALYYRERTHVCRDGVALMGADFGDRLAQNIRNYWSQRGGFHAIEIEAKGSVVRSDMVSGSPAPID